MTTAVVTSLIKSNIMPATAGDITNAAKSIVRNTAFIIASLLSSPSAMITIQSFSRTILHPTDAIFAIFDMKITMIGVIQFDSSYEKAMSMKYKHFI